MTHSTARGLFLGLREGRENRPRSRHCDRPALETPAFCCRLPGEEVESQETYPELVEADTLREKECGEKPRLFSRGFFVAWVLSLGGSHGLRSRHDRGRIFTFAVGEHDALGRASRRLSRAPIDPASLRRRTEARVSSPMRLDGVSRFLEK